MSYSILPYEFTFDDILLLPNKSTFLIDQEKQKINLTTHVTKKLTIDIPIVSSPMPGVTESAMAIALAQKGGLGMIHHFQSFQRQLNEVEKVKSKHLKVAASVAVLDESGLTHIGNLAKLGIDLVSIETPHAFNTHVLKFLQKVKKRYPSIQISVALVLTKNATKELIKSGADNIRVGIGGGSHCTTRLVTGIGRPQLSALQECVKEAKKYNIPVMSDTGIKYPGDITKALYFGASSVMIGGLFTGTDESPGEIVQKKGKKFKKSWGMCTSTAMDMLNEKLSRTDIFKLTTKNYVKSVLRKNTKSNNFFQEGVEGFIPYKGDVQSIIDNLVNGVYRSFWYIGAKEISELSKKSRFIVISPQTKLENMPRIPYDSSAY